MTDREKVIKGLERCNAPNNHYDCPYNGAEHYNICTHRLLNDAIEALKAQQPRVMTLEEANDADVCWAEGRDGWDATPPRRMSLWNWNEVRLYRFASEEYVSLKPNEYGKTWRCWTARPTEAQREAVSWDD